MTGSASTSVHEEEEEEEDDGNAFSFMEEPASFRPATPEPSAVTYERRVLGGQGERRGDATIQVGLVSGHPLWGHILYPAAIALSRFLELHSDRLLRNEKGKGKNVLELGAGGGLPGLVSALEGAGQVVISDFPDASLVNNIHKNIQMNIGHLGATEGVAKTTALGFTWGNPPQEMLNTISTSSADAEIERFDLILLSDLVFNHSQHGALLDSCLACLSLPSSSPPLSAESTSTSASTDDPDQTQLSIDLSSPSFSPPALLCFYSHHRPTPELIAADLRFLSLAQEKGWTVKKVWEDANAGPAFPLDGGDIGIRSTVHGWSLTRE